MAIIASGHIISGGWQTHISSAATAAKPPTDLPEACDFAGFMASMRGILGIRATRRN